MTAEVQRGRSTPRHRLHGARARAASRDRIIEENLPLVRTLARRFAHPTEPIDDLVQVGTIGLIKAVDGFRRERGTDLGAYAVPTIVGELRHHRRRTVSSRRPSMPLDDTVAASTDDGGLERRETRDALRAGFRALSRRERRIVGLRYYRDLSQERIAAEVGLSQAQVSRELSSALDKLRVALEPSE